MDPDDYADAADNERKAAREHTYPIEVRGTFIVWADSDAAADRELRRMGYGAGHGARVRVIESDRKATA